MALGQIVQPGYRVREGRAVVQIHGRLRDGEPFVVEDDRFRPYFFVPRHDARLLADARGAECEETSLTTLAGVPVVRVSVGLPGEVPALRERVRRAGGNVLEADVRFPYRYLMDHGLRSGVAIEGPAERTARGALRFRNPKLEPAEVRAPLRVLSLDLETTPDASRLYSVALAGCDVEEVHLVSGRPVAGAVVHADQRRLLEAAAARIVDLDPDVLTGWNVVDFDLRTWAERSRALGVRAELGREPGEILFQRDLGFTRQGRASLPGRCVLDALPLARDALRLADYRLETVAQSVLGRGKRMDAGVRDAAAEITRLYREDPEALVAYNLEDARLVLEILEREALLELALERSRLTGMQLDRVGASIACFDLLVLPELRRRGLVAPSVRTEAERGAPIRGGAVLDPVPGLFECVAVYDFTSLYPSLIRSFHLDPLAHAQAGDDAIVAPNGARFSRADAILPSVIERFQERRARARERGDRHADQAIKIMMNALFGVLAAPSCRFFDPEVANAITGFGQQTLRETRDAFEASGVRVIYGDTDSVFVQLTARGEEAAREATGLREQVQERLRADLRERYRVEPRLELKLERVFDRFFLPRVRGGKGGSKKRYAGWSGGELHVVGLEAVRRASPGVAGRLQRGMLERLFTDRDLLPFVKETVEQVRAGALDPELVYVRRVRKAALESYTATTPPHVQAARKAGGRLGPVVRYVITARGPEPCLPDAPLPADIDYRHYVERVLRPVAEAILAPLGRDFDEAAGAPHQLSLL